MFRDDTVAHAGFYRIVYCASLAPPAEEPFRKRTTQVEVRARQLAALLRRSYRSHHGFRARLLT